MMLSEDAKSTNSCLLRLQAILNGLKPAEKRVAEYILTYPKKILTITMSQLATQTSASYATVNRLIKRIGYSGFKELKRFLYQDVMDNQSLDTAEIISFSLRTPAAEICQNIFSFASSTLYESIQVADIGLINQATDQIVQGKSLTFLGGGTSGICAKYAFSRFMRIGVRVFFCDDNILTRMQATLLGENDVLFAISSSGRTSDILECAQIAKSNGATVISLTDYAISPLSQMADTALFTTSRNTDLFMTIDMPLLICQIALIDAVFMCCCVKMGVRTTELYQITKKSAELDKVN